MHRRVAAVCAMLAVASIARADLHEIQDLDPANLYDVVSGGATILSGLQPDADGVLRFETAVTGGFEVVPNGVGDVTAPGDVTDLVVSSVTSHTALLRWTAPGDDGQTGTAAAYEISWSTVSGNLGPSAVQALNVPPPSPAGTPESFMLVRLPAGTRLYAAVRARDDAGRWSDLSNVVTFDTLEEEGQPDAVAPGTVADLTVIGVGPSSVTLEWTAVGDDGMSGTATLYDLRYAEASIDVGSFEDATSVPGLSAPLPAGGREEVTVTGLEPSQSYAFAVVVEDEAGNRSPVSPAAQATTAPPDAGPLLPPGAPAAAFADGVITLTWPPVAAPALVGYFVYRRPEGSTETRLTVAPIAQPSYTDTDVVLGAGYFYRVTAVDSSMAESPASATTWIRAAPAAPPALAIERVYPSPIRDEAVFRFAIPETGPGSPDGVHVTLELFDVAGRRVGRVVDERLMPGTREVRWRPAATGTPFAPGLYVSVLTAAGRSVRAPIAVAR